MPDTESESNRRADGCISWLSFRTEDFGKSDVRHAVVAVSVKKRAEWRVSADGGIFSRNNQRLSVAEVERLENLKIVPFAIYIKKVYSRGRHVLI